VDVLGLLGAVVAVALFPGGIYAAAVAVAALPGTRMPAAEEPWTGNTVAAAILLLCAAALVPLPDSPVIALPPNNGAPANLLAAMVLGGAGFAVGMPPRWSRARLLAGIAAAVPLLVLAASAATLSFPVVVALPGRRLAAARALAAVALLLAAPVLTRVYDHCLPRGLRALGLAVPALFAAVLLAPPGWSNLAAPAAAAMVVGGTVLYGGLVGLLAVTLRRRAIRAAGSGAALAAIASIVLTALAAR
jgi:hypothetical protein